MPWVKGQSGNPKGKPRGANTLATVVRAQTLQGAALVEFALAVMKGEHGAEMPDRLDAMKWLGDRGWGKAVEHIELRDETSEPAAPETIAVDHLEAVAGARDGFVQ